MHFNCISHVSSVAIRGILLDKCQDNKAGHAHAPFLSLCKAALSSPGTAKQKQTPTAANLRVLLDCYRSHYINTHHKKLNPPSTESFKSSNNCTKWPKLFNLIGEVYE